MCRAELYRVARELNLKLPAACRIEPLSVMSAPVIRGKIEEVMGFRQYVTFEIANTDFDDPSVFVRTLIFQPPFSCEVNGRPHRPLVLPLLVLPFLPPSMS